MRTFTKDDDTILCFDENVYKQERNVMYFSHNPSSFTAEYVRIWSNLQGSWSEPIAEYSLDVNERAIIDVSDYVRAFPSVSMFYVECQQDEVIEIPLTVVGLISPESLIVPRNIDGARIQFPTVLLAAIGNLTLSYEFSDKDYADYRLGNTSGHMIVPTYDGAYNVVGTSAAVYKRTEHIVRTHHMGYFYAYEGQEGAGYKWKNEHPRSPLYIYTANRDPLNGDDAFYDSALTQKAPTGINGEDWFALSYYTNVKPLDCERRYVAVRWVAATGITRLHTFEMRDLMQSADDITKFETADGTYSVSRGRVDGFKLYLENLNAYDYWYYADVINSSTVEVSLDGENWRTVEVLTKSVTIPNTNSGKLSNLEISVNWREYDAVTM